MYRNLCIILVDEINIFYSILFYSILNPEPSYPESHRVINAAPAKWCCSLRQIFLLAFFLKTKNEFPETFAKRRSKTAGMPDCSASDQFGTGLKKN
jgi:hypothetical protein